MVLRRFLAGALALTAVLAGGCTSDSADSADRAPGEPLPDAASLIRSSAAATGEITSTHFTMRAEGKVPGLSVRGLEGDLTKKGEAKGTGTLTQSGKLVEVEFVLTGGTLYLKGPTGGYQQIPAALSSSVYDPSAVLDPERGVARLISGMRNPTTEAAEEVGGTQTYKVTGTVAQNVLAGLLPGVRSDADLTVWLRKDGRQLPVQASAGFPNGGTVEVTLSDVDKPVTVTPPA